MKPWDNEPIEPEEKPPQYAVVDIHIVASLPIEDAVVHAGTFARALTDISNGKGMIYEGAISVVAEKPEFALTLEPSKEPTE